MANVDFITTWLSVAILFSQLVVGLVLPPANGVERVFGDGLNFDAHAVDSDVSGFPTFDVVLAARQIPSFTPSVPATSTPGVPATTSTPVSVPPTTSTPVVPSASNPSVSIPATPSTPAVPSVPATQTSVAPAATSSTASSSDSSGSSTGAIAGGVVGGIAGVALIAGILFFCWRKGLFAGKKQDSEQEESSDSPSPLPPAEEKDFSVGRYDSYQEGSTPSTVSGHGKSSRRS